MIVYSVLRLRRYFVFADPAEIRREYRQLRASHNRQVTRFMLTAGLMPAATPI